MICAASGGAVCPVAPTVPQLQAGVAIPVLPGGGSVTLTLSGMAAASGTITNVATVSPPVGVTDPTPDDDKSTVITAIGSSPVPIPTLNAAMMALFAIVLCLLAVRSIARRRQ